MVENVCPSVSQRYPSPRDQGNDGEATNSRGHPEVRGEDEAMGKERGSLRGPHDAGQYYGRPLMTKATGHQFENTNPKEANCCSRDNPDNQDEKERSTPREAVAVGQ
ncbi:hypothetical protein Back2_28570 [Nocardioides baekrokdamisoli]|uniref:Uncharacterized protein n=1 Tax=Nocardioides baekrokdamisoli TaxID=1804624 RepID=A0A3G9IHU5_9ACTN|nr:hypothetical protein Back2_28570 [Nocardioides baekrokdamisoli]